MLMTRLESCSLLSMPRKKPKKNKISPYCRKRKCLIKKKLKLCTLLRFRGSDLSVNTVKTKESKIKGIDNDICKSHIKEHECNEARALTRVKEDPKYFFRYAKKFNRTSKNNCPLLNGDGKLTNDTPKITRILSNQFCSTFFYSKIILRQ